MNIEKAKKEFFEYTNKYDTQNENISMRIEHSIRVMEISEQIAKNLNLEDEQIKLAKLIGLLHDIARFEQWTRYQTFKDSISCDHGDLGVEILEKDQFIRNFIEEEKYDKIILIAIKNHNKYKIEKNLTEEELLFSKIIRDADKLDIMYEGVEMLWNDKEEKNRIEKSDITPEVYNEFALQHTIDRKYNKLQADRIITFIAFIFDVNYKYSFKIIKKEDYINKILNKFDFKQKEKMKEIRDIANRYIEARG